MLTIGLVAAGGLLIAVVFFILGASSARDSKVVSLTQPPPPERSLTGEARDAVETALKQGRKIDAIKLYREATGAGLRESKEAVEAMER